MTDQKNFVRTSETRYSRAMTAAEIAPESITEKQAEILSAATQAFDLHGYRRTSMDDIARQAGMSRSALYLHYRNKEDIFRHLVERFFAQAIRDMEQALNAPGQTPEQALSAAFRAKDGSLIELVFSSPHGAELMEAGLTLNPEIAQRAEGAKIAILTRWLQGLSMPPDIGPPETVARTILTSAMGLKFPGQTLEGYRQGQTHLARLFARAIAG